VITEQSVENARLQSVQRGGPRPLTENSDQKVLEFQ
jgi:hypothetical protein